MTPPARASRPFDIVLFGATGFTGRLVAEYLARRPPHGAVWAIAGRSRDKLEAVKAELVAIDPKLASLEILLADSADAASLQAVTQKTRVVCTTVGPYAKYGRTLVAICAENGTHYCDLTGEVPFVRESIDRNHDVAQRSGARIVHCTGFDSIPSDLGTFMVSEHLRAKGRRLRKAHGFVGPMRGGLSGGTFSSMLALFEGAQKDRELLRLLGDPYALLPDRKADRGTDRGDLRSVRFDRTVSEFIGPFVMASINTRVVRRTNAILGWPYGKDFEYREVMSFGRGVRGLARASMMTAGLATFVMAASSKTGRRLLKPILPEPGGGPSKESREHGFFRVRIVGESDAQSGEAPLVVVGIVKGTSDPGYGETAKMLGESALCLALDSEKLEPRAGVLTPAAAMGMHVVDRLRDAGMTFRVDD